MSYGNDNNKLEDSIFCLLASTEMTGLMQGLSIIRICIRNPIQWLATKTHELTLYRWSARHMSQVHDDLEAALEKVINKPSLFIN